MIVILSVTVSLAGTPMELTVKSKDLFMRKKLNNCHNDYIKKPCNKLPKVI